MPATAARCGRAPASRRAAIRISAGVRTLTTPAWTRVTLDGHRAGLAVRPEGVAGIQQRASSASAAHYASVAVGGARAAD